MEDTFNVNNGFPILQQKPLPLGLKKCTRPDDNVYFTTESYEDQLMNRREDGTIIPLGYPVNIPMTRNGQPMSYYYYQGSVNGLNKRNTGTLTEPRPNENKAPIASPNKEKQNEVVNALVGDKGSNEIVGNILGNLLDNLKI